MKIKKKTLLNKKDPHLESCQTITSLTHLTKSEITPFNPESPKLENDEIIIKVIPPEKSSKPNNKHSLKENINDFNSLSLSIYNFNVSKSSIKEKKVIYEE